MTKLSPFLKSQKMFLLIFLVCFIYWGYLIFASSMVVQFDAISYEELGRMIYKEGWKAFFATGPHREPLYPLLVAFSMKIGDLFGVF